MIFCDICYHKMVFLVNVGTLYKGIVEKRPSAFIKTPYVADVFVNDESVLAHSAALGCSGLIDTNKIVYMTKVESEKNKCAYKIVACELCEKGKTYLIGVDPKFAETITSICLTKNLLSKMNVSEFVREKKFLNSRFDFYGLSDDEPFILEVKNVPLADYVDCEAKQKKNMNFDHYDINDKIAYFPDGYRKKKDQPVSERAIKHINELKEIHVNQHIRTIICFVIQRSDISSFQPSYIDMHYRNAIQDAVNHGVEVKTIVCEWDYDGNINFITDDLTVNIFDRE